MFITALVIIAKSRKYPAGKWITIICCILTMEYYLAIKTYKFLIYATAWVNHKNMHSEKDQT